MGKKSGAKQTKRASQPAAAVADESPPPSAAATPLPSPTIDDRKSPSKSGAVKSTELPPDRSDSEPGETDGDLVSVLLQQLRLIPCIGEMASEILSTAPLVRDEDCREVIAECIRSNASAVLAFLTDRFLHGSNSDDCLRYRVRSLSDELHALPAKFRTELCVILQLDPQVSMSGLGSTFMAIGSYMAVILLPPNLAGKVAKALSVPIPKAPDPDVCREFLSQALAHRMVPAAALPLPLAMLVKIIVEEVSPGRFLCTVDNAKLMCMVPRLCSTSEKFTFAKVSWRISLHTKDDRISLSLWHRSAQPVAVRLSLTIEDVDSKPKRVRRSSITQIVEGQLNASEPIGFDGVVLLSEFANKSSRVYNAVEDRLSFVVELESLPVTKVVTLEDLVAEEEEERQKKNQLKNRQKIDKKVKQLETSETQAREKVAAAASLAQQAIDAEGRRIKSQPASKQKKEREKKPAEDETEAEAPIEPDLQLEAQVIQLQKVIQTARSAVSKLSNERHKEDRELQRLRSAVAEKQLEVDGMEASKSEMTKTIDGLQAEVAKLMERKQWLEEHRRQREEHKRSMAFACDTAPLAPIVQPQVHVSAPFTSFQWSEKSPTTTVSPQSQPIVIETMGSPIGSFHGTSTTSTPASLLPSRRMIPPPRTVAQHLGTPPSQVHSRQTSQTFTAVPLPRSSELRAHATPPFPPPSPSPPGGFLPTQSPFGWSAFQ